MNVDVRRTAAGVVDIAVAGVIDLATAPDLKRVLFEALDDADTRTILVDLAEVSFCDSSGIATLDEAYGAAAERAMRLRVTNESPRVRRVLEIVGMLETLTQPLK
ncbi:STAS domain-containing protein [Actinoplanes sp. CA-015351]|uniref:STAS domain-containing protein n=1 Tax=Actinoplanes sp. CA-015351 TaxID=3239897 RepID=UPI003D9645B0